MRGRIVKDGVNYIVLVMIIEYLIRISEDFIVVEIGDVLELGVSIVLVLSKVF